MTGLWAFKVQLSYPKYQGPPIVVRFTLLICMCYQGNGLLHFMVPGSNLCLSCSSTFKRHKWYFYRHNSITMEDCCHVVTMQLYLCIQLDVSRASLPTQSSIYTLVVLALINSYCDLCLSSSSITSKGLSINNVPSKREGGGS